MQLHSFVLGIQMDNFSAGGQEVAASESDLPLCCSPAVGGSQAQNAPPGAAQCLFFGSQTSVHCVGLPGLLSWLLTSYLSPQKFVTSFNFLLCADLL